MMKTGQSRRRRLERAKSDMAGPRPQDFVKSAMPAHDPPKCVGVGVKIMRLSTIWSHNRNDPPRGKPNSTSLETAVLVAVHPMSPQKQSESEPSKGDLWVF